MKPNHRLSKRLTRMLAGAFAFSFVAVAGATTMKTVIAFDKKECDVFRKMIVEADVAHLTDKQLCDFRFARLPSSKTAGFTFPHWSQLKVDDPVEVFRKSSEGNMRPNRPVELGYPRPDIIESATIAAGAGNLGFYTTDVQLERKGPTMTLLSADFISCPASDFDDEMGLPALWVFRDRELLRQEPMSPSSLTTDGAQVALRGGTVPVTLTIFDRWVKRWPSDKGALVVSMQRLFRQGDAVTPEFIGSALVCEIRISKCEDDFDRRL